MLITELPHDVVEQHICPRLSYGDRFRLRQVCSFFYRIVTGGFEFFRRRQTGLFHAPIVTGGMVGRRVVFSPDGALVMYSTQGTVTVLNATNGEQLTYLPGHVGLISDMAVSSTGLHFGVVCGGPLFYIWTITQRVVDTSVAGAPGARVAGELVGVPDSLNSDSSDRDDATDAGSAVDGRRTNSDVPPCILPQRRRWSDSSGDAADAVPDAQPSARASPQAKAPRSSIAWLFSRRTVRLPYAVSLAFSPDGQQVACGTGRFGEHNSIVVLAVDSLSTLLTLSCPTASAAVAYAPHQPQYLFSLSYGSTVQMWDLHSRQLRCALSLDHELAPTLAVAPPDDTAGAVARVALATALGAVGLWTVIVGAAEPAGALAAQCPVPEASPPAAAGAVLSAGRLQPVQYDAAEVCSLAFDPTGDLLAIAGADGAVALCDGRTGARLSRFQSPAAEPVAALFAPVAPLRLYVFGSCDGAHTGPVASAARASAPSDRGGTDRAAAHASPGDDRRADSERGSAAAEDFSCSDDGGEPEPEPDLPHACISVWQ